MYPLLVGLAGRVEAGARVRKRTALFCGYWYSLDGRRLERASRAQLREAARLYWKHKDMRFGRVEAE